MERVCEVGGGQLVKGLVCKEQDFELNTAGSHRRGRFLTTQYDQG